MERWTSLHPTTARLGRFSEVPASYLLPRVAGVLALAGVLWYSNSALLWVQKPATLNPEFVAEAKRIGNVAVGAGWAGWRARCVHAACSAAQAGRQAGGRTLTPAMHLLHVVPRPPMPPPQQRVNGPPVFLNPFTHRIPGGVRGPEDLLK